MRWNALILQKKFRAKTLHTNVLKCAEMRWNFTRNALKTTEFSKVSHDWNRTLLYGAVAFTQSTAPMLLETLPTYIDFISIDSLGRKALKLCKHCAENSEHLLHIFSAFQRIFKEKVHRYIGKIKWFEIEESVSKSTQIH